LGTGDTKVRLLPDDPEEKEENSKGPVAFAFSWGSAEGSRHSPRIRFFPLLFGST
jgi:hypothetical protein